MRRLAVSLIAVAALSAPIRAGAEGSLVDHQPVRCVVAGTFPWIDAGETGGHRAVWGRVRFRRADSGEWFGVRMKEEGARWVAALPRPTKALDRFVYAVELSDEASEPFSSEDFTVRVAKDAAGCAPDAPGPSKKDARVSLDVTSAMAAAGVSLPEGFDDKGTQAKESRVGVFGLNPAASVGVAAAVGAGAFALAASKSEQSPESQPASIQLVESNPAAGSTLSTASINLALRFRITLTVLTRPGTVVVSLLGPANASCVGMQALHGGFVPAAALDVTVSQVQSVNCPAPFSVAEAAVSVRDGFGNEVFAQVVPVAYHFVP